MNIILCGFMGCGKSTIGRAVAQRLGYDFIDTDKFIEDKEKMSVSQIFKKYSENGFRDIEHNACLEIADRDNTVVATGGGAMLFERNVTALKNNGVVVFLEVEESEIIRRLRNDKSRPLIQNKSDDEIIELYNSRKSAYLKAADRIFNCSVSLDENIDNLTAIFLDK